MKKTKNNLIMQLCYGIDYNINSYPVMLPTYVSYYILWLCYKNIYGNYSFHSYNDSLNEKI